MRLINTYTLQLTGPYVGDDKPPYAILSHTWGENELSYQDMVNVSQHRHKSGFRKILSFCARARKDGYRYGWMDTVCIDKTSSAELSEAINSMYRWYSKSAVCYVFLEDLAWDETLRPPISILEKCRWFSRGWTLQELIAPELVVFANANWVDIGDKKSLAFSIADITGIDVGTLHGFSVKRISTACRMSWASHRKTTRPEDLAYCLLGIFGINMPLLYGEGEKAFIRLQEEILRNSDDHSIFAWSIDDDGGPAKFGCWSLLAPSPAYFKNSAEFVPVRGQENSVEHAITNRGISLKATTNPLGTQLVINCRPKDQPRLCMIPIVRLRSGMNDYARLIDHNAPLPVPPDLIESGTMEMQISVRNNIYEEDFENQYSINYMEICSFPNKESGYTLEGYSTNYDPDSRMIRTSPFPYMTCGAVLLFQHRTEKHPPFAVALFEIDLAWDPDWRSQDFVGVYNYPPERKRGFYPAIF